MTGLLLLIIVLLLALVILMVDGGGSLCFASLIFRIIMCIPMVLGLSGTVTLIIVVIFELIVRVVGGISIGTWETISRCLRGPFGLFQTILKIVVVITSTITLLVTLIS